MRRSRIVALLACVLCVSMLLPSCKLHKKTSTEDSTIDTEETDETPRTTRVSETTVPSMMVTSLDQFITDGNVFSEDLPLPTPTPIPFTQISLGYTNEDDGYFSGALENATIVDNDLFRFTIVNTEVSQEAYIVNSQFENKSDVPYRLKFLNPTFDGCAVEDSYVTEILEPHKVLDDVTNFTATIANYGGTEPDQIAFLLLAIPIDTSMSASIQFEKNYVPCMLFPHGEEAYIFQDRVEVSGSSILYDSEVGQFAIDQFEISELYFSVTCSFLNKSSEYVMLRATNGQVMLDDTYFDLASSTAVYVAPYSRLTYSYTVSLSSIEGSGIDPQEVKLFSMNLEADTLYYDIAEMWESLIRKEIVFG